ncbi:MAG TPA: efflux RND transporter periplasmic adaptor subunit [Steroidobacteraceae bacterium]|nr:efflux RND transporter periplasmic adaptor subunit [Steroidobacteraceae bacterium]
MNTDDPKTHADDSKVNSDSKANADDPKAPPSLKARLLRLTPLALVLLALGAGILPRLKAHAALRAQTDSLSTPVVSVVHAKAAPAVQRIELPADVQAYQDASIFARTNGYLAHWYKDIGTQVPAGELLATIETPEVDAQLEQARADEKTAQVQYDIAKVTADRWVGLLKTNAVSREVTEQDVATMRARAATLAAAQANVRRLGNLQSYEKVVAPFAGVVTARNIDVGALIDSGSAGGAKMELFHLAETDKLRVFVDVPQVYAPDMQPGVPATLSLPQRPDRPLRGTVARTSGAINSASRTLRVEVDVDNEDGAVLPGAYALVDLDVTASHPLLSVPVNTLLFRPNGVQVAIVDGTGKAQLRTVTLGRDFGTTIEVTSGLDASESVIANPGDAIAPGDAVRVAENPPSAEKPSKSPSAGERA